MAKSIGGWAFLIGLIMAVVIAAFGTVAGTWAYLVLTVLGLIVGFFNVSGRETVPFLVATIAFMVTFQSLSVVVGKLPLVGEFFVVFFGLVNIFIGPAAAVVALSALYHLSKN